MIDALLQAVLTTMGDHDALRLSIMVGQQGLEVAVTVLAVRVVIHLPALLLQVGGEVAHGTEDQGDLLLVMLYISGFIGQFGHDQPVPLFIQVRKGWQAQAELIAENDTDFHPCPLRIFTLTGHDGRQPVQER